MGDPRIDVQPVQNTTGDPMVVIMRPNRDLLQLLLAGLMFGQYAPRVEDALAYASQLLDRAGVASDPEPAPAAVEPPPSPPPPPST